MRPGSSPTSRGSCAAFGKPAWAPAWALAGTARKVAGQSTAKITIPAHILAGPGPDGRIVAVMMFSENDEGFDRQARQRTYTKVPYRAFTSGSTKRMIIRLSVDERISRSCGSPGGASKPR